MNNQLERFPGILAVGGVLVFLVTLLVSLVLPLIAIVNESEDTASFEDLAADPDGSGFADLADMFPEQFQETYPEGATPANYADALERGRDVYVENACFQCHTQSVRPFEAAYHGAAASSREQNNDLMHPALIGNRRVGPDLSRYGHVHDTQWLVDYLYDPTSQVAHAVGMPAYPWLFERRGEPNLDGIALISYLRWLGDYQPVSAASADESPEE